jgi:hypothetical protein
MIGGWVFNKAHGEKMKVRRLRKLRIIYQPLGPPFLFPSSGLIAPLMLFCSQPWTFILIFEIIFTYLKNTMASLPHGTSKAYLLKIHA